MKWIEVTVDTSREAADAVSELFFSMGCQGVSVKDDNDIAEALRAGKYWDYVDESLLCRASESVLVTSFFMEEEYEVRVKELEEGLSRLSKSFSGASVSCGPLKVKTALLDDSDWENNWKQYYKPITVNRLQIVPEWLKDQRDENLIPIYLDPGMAFGTGEHETTRMCLELLQELEPKDKTVYDIGCGSGILGIASVLLGAKAAHLSDIDPTSVLTAEKNAEKNRVRGRLTVSLSDLLSSGSGEKADIVVANISADILIRLSESISKVLKTGGAVVLSGIINRRLAEVEEAYMKAGFKLVGERTVGDWSAVSLSFRL